MIRRLFAFVLALCLGCTMLSACQNRNATEPTKETEPTMETMDKNHPGRDDTLSILMVGNSFCYYYVEELYGLLMANADPNRGYEKVQIFNLYYSGCSLTQHLSWWQTGQANYQLYKTDADGRVEMEPSKQWTLENALKQGKWDYISLQGSIAGGSYVTGGTDLHMLIGQTAQPLLELFHQQHPHAKLLWHRTWPFEVGRVSGETTYTEDMLVKYNEGMQAACEYMCTEFVKDKDYTLTMVNSGAAWVRAREANAKLETSLIPEGGLCARLGKRNENTFPYFPGNPDAGDGYHDGDIGGAQFLNACVWYETITGQSCLDNPYKPTLENGKYELSDEFAALLRDAAHG